MLCRGMALAMTGDDILAMMEEHFPQAAALGLTIPELEEGRIQVAWPTGDKHLRPGGTISGPTMMTLADTAMYFLVLAHIGPVPLAVTTSLNINFLRRPAPGDLIADARLLKLGSRLAVGDVIMHSAPEPDSVVAQAAVTYSIPPPGERRAS
jgi:uncharacterized protein (TIGR00369 family)